jgi:hypothetical protein
MELCGALARMTLGQQPGGLAAELVRPGVDLERGHGSLDRIRGDMTRFRPGEAVNDEARELMESMGPTRPIRDEGPGDKLEEGIGLCLSGGGYRAMLFHVGSLWRLNETGYLSRLDRVSSVSGGSITAAQLAIAWPDMNFAGGVASAYVERVAAPLRKLAEETIDRSGIVRGLLTPGSI